MVTVPSFVSVRSIGQFLRDSKYDAPELSTTFGLKDGLHSNLDNLETLLYKTQGDTLLAVLARLFFVGAAVEADLVASLIPADVLQDAVACGLLCRSNGHLQASAIILPFKHLYLAADLSQSRISDPNVVVGPSASTHLLSGFTITDPVSTVLDVGTGGGVLALEAAVYGAHVTGIDINERALAYARFNAALNGISNVEFAAGNAFAPVAGLRFHRIIANPPFFITASQKFTYSDSPIALDGFSRLLAKEASQYLEEGGFFQMLCEWVQVEDEPWTQRLQEWTKDSGCDTFVVRGPQESAVEYAEKRHKEALQLYPKDLITSIPDRLAFFKQHRVETIVGGLVFMRKRPGKNWFSNITGNSGVGSAGPPIVERFDTMTFVATHSPAEILESRLKLTEDTGIEERKVLETVESEKVGSWKVVSSELAKNQGFQDRLKLDSVVTGFIGLFDGSRTVAEIAALVSKSLGWPEEEARSRCIALARRLLQSSFVKPVVSQ